VASEIRKIFRARRLLAAGAGVHFLLIFVVSCRETSWLVSQGLTILPSSFKSAGARIEKISSAALGSGLAKANPLRQAVAAYIHVAGTEGGYGFFAPNVPDSCTLLFEIHNADDSVEYALSPVQTAAADLRVAGLLDKLGRSEYDPLREGLIKMLARSVWQAHPHAKSIRAVFGSVRLPSISEFEAGKKPSFEFLSAYDFSLKADAAKSEAQ
jgi:hypothetical protein